MNDIQLNTEQQKAHDLAVDFANSNHAQHHLLTIGGYAGVGKTTVTGEIIRTLKQDGKAIAMCTLAGKASTILKRKTGDVLGERDFCGTICKLIYNLVRADKDERGRPDLEFERHMNHLDYDLIVIDEASMVNHEYFDDLADHGIPILAIGDHGQLPPIPPKGWDKKNPGQVYSFNLMKNPDIKLETILRQASDNPIVKISQMARETGNIPVGMYGPHCVKTTDSAFLHKFPFGSADSQMLCANNKTRCGTNAFARFKLGIQSDLPVAGEPVICLANNAKANLFNGMIGNIESIEYNCRTEEGYPCYRVSIIFEGGMPWRGNIHPGSFGSAYGDRMENKPFDLEFFDWSYCITTHKFQGSESSFVLVREERLWKQTDDNWRRWLYTAVTRAKDKLIIFKD